MGFKLSMRTLKDGSLRFSIDYRCLRNATVADIYLLLGFDDCINSLGLAKKFPDLDAFSGYWKIFVKEWDCGKTSLVCRTGLNPYPQMPFGPTDASASFEHARDVIHTWYTWKTYLKYTDDIIILSACSEKLITHVGKKLSMISHSNATAKLSESEFISTSIMHLDHVT